MKKSSCAKYLVFVGLIGVLGLLTSATRISAQELTPTRLTQIQEIKLSPKTKPVLRGDCNSNRILDSVDIKVGSSQDCNHNSIPDECDVKSRYAFNVNNNLIPDECEAEYVIIELSALSGSDGRLNGVNDVGIGVGSSTTGAYSNCYVSPQIPYADGPIVHAIRFEGNRITDLATLVADVNSYSRAYAINTRGMAVGESGYMCLGPYQSHAVAWQSGGMLDLGTLGGLNSSANDVNDAAQVVGWAMNSTGKKRAFIWQNGSMQELASTANESYAMALNSLGDVVGVHGSMLWGQAVLWRNNQRITLSNYGVAMGINDSTQVVGDAPNPKTSKYEAVMWDNGNTTFLGALNGGYSTAYDINNSGVIVGHSKLINATPEAFVSDENGIRNLNSLIPPNSGWTLEHAAKINDAGEIVGFGVKAGKSKGFRLIPTR